MTKIYGDEEKIFPLISVVIPAFNAEKTICRAIESVRSQTYPNVEIVVVDDNSSDNTLATLQPYLSEVKVVTHTQNLNGAAARNSGVKASKGDFIAFLDSDDSFLPEKLGIQLNQLCVIPGGSDGAVCLACGEVGGSNKRKDCGIVKVSPLAIFHKNYSFNTSSILIGRDLFEAIGGFDESFQRHQDLEFFVRLAKKGALFYFAEPLLKREFSGSPSFKSTKLGIEAFWKKFNSDIISLSKEQRRLVWALGFRRLAELAFNERKIVIFLYFSLKAALISPGLILGKIPYYLRRAAKNITGKGI